MTTKRPAVRRRVGLGEPVESAGRSSCVAQLRGQRLRRRRPRPRRAGTARAAWRARPSRAGSRSTDSRIRLNSGAVQRRAVARPRSSTAIAGPSVARGPAVSGTMRSASRIASSTSLVISTTVLRSSPQMRLDLVLQRRARQRVERAERLVEQQHLRVHRQRARHRHALAHAAGELAPAACRVAARGSPSRGTPRRAAARRSAVQSRVDLVHRELDVFVDRQPRQQRVVLEHDAAIGPGAVIGLPSNSDACRRPGACSPAISEIERRLAGARVADDGDELALARPRG